MSIYVTVEKISQILLTWMKSRYDAQEMFEPERPPKYEEVSYGGMKYNKVTVCGLGCFPYYHIKQNGKIYGFLGFTVGPDENKYQSDLSKILSSIKYY